MDRINRIFVVLLLFVIVADASSARFRLLADDTTSKNQTTNSTKPGLDRNGALDDKKNKTETKGLSVNGTHVEPVLNDTNPKSVTGKGTKSRENSTDSNPVVEKGSLGKENGTKNSSILANNPANNTTADGGKNLTRENSTAPLTSPANNGTRAGNLPEGSDLKKGDEDRKKEKNGAKKSNSESGDRETCTGFPDQCTLSMITACVRSYDEGSGNLSVLVQNVGKKTLTVKLTFPSAVENPSKELKLSRHQTQMIDKLLKVGKSLQVILNVENEKCLLHKPLEPKQDVYMHLPSFDQLATLVNGAYFLILSVLLFGGIWACCKFRKRKYHDGVPYQELEMGLPVSASAANVESAEGWDEGWDDDWDEDNAVKSPGGAPHVGSISANGLTSRTTTKDGWENDWDD